MADVACERCGHRNAADANFCSSCGAPLPAAADDPPTMSFEIDGVDDEGVNIDLLEVPSGGLLVVRSGPNAGSRFAIDKDLLTVGRHPDSDVFLDDITVSRRHVEILRDESDHRVRDVGSLNGTYVNRERIEEASLTDGDELQVGKFKLTFLAGADADAETIEADPA